MFLVYVWLFAIFVELLYIKDALNELNRRTSMEEERILVLKVEPTCIYRELHETTAGGFTEVDLMCGKQKRTKCDEEHFAKCKCKELNGLSKEEAIERMAKAICLERNACISKGEMCGLCVLWRNFSTHAEKALNALLEGK